jgi:putative transposase
VDPSRRAQHTRVLPPYQPDLSDAEGLLISHILPAEPATGRRWEWPMREIINAIFHVLHGGIV